MIPEEVSTLDLILENRKLKGDLYSANVTIARLTEERDEANQHAEQEAHTHDSLRAQVERLERGLLHISYHKSEPYCAAFAKLLLDEEALNPLHSDSDEPFDQPALPGADTTLRKED